MKYIKIKSVKPLLLAAMVAVGGVSVSHAEQSPPTAKDPASQLNPEQRAHLERFQKKRAELMQLGQQLDQIRQEAERNNPQLKEKEKAFGEMVATEMKKNGGTPKEDLAELRELQAKLRDQNTPDADRQALMVRLQRKAQEFDQARRQALQNPELQKAQGELLQDMMAAMKKQDPRAEQIMQQMQQTQQEMIQIRNEAQAAGAK